MFIFHKKNKFKKLILTTIFFITFKTNPIYAKCYWLGYGANYKCNDNTGNQYYVFGKKNSNGYYKKNFKSGQKANCKWLNGKLDCKSF